MRRKRQRCGIFKEPTSLSALLLSSKLAQSMSPQRRKRTNLVTSVPKASEPSLLSAESVPTLSSQRRKCPNLVTSPSKAYFTAESVSIPITSPPKASQSRSPQHQKCLNPSHLTTESVPLLILSVEGVPLPL